jgi:hypothetical protein
MSSLQRREIFRTSRLLDFTSKRGPILPKRKPVLEVWLAAAPKQPLPRRLAAVELVRIAREHRLEQSGELTDILAEAQPTDEEGQAA